MTSAVSICSNASLLLGGKTISDFSEDTDRARIASNLFETVRDATLRSHPWNCAVKRVRLSPDANAPSYGYDNQFTMPGDCLRILVIGDDDQTDYNVEGRKILCNEPELLLKYIFRNEVEATWDSTLIHAVTLGMAAAMAYAITGSATAGDGFAAQAREALKYARAVDGQENPPETLGDFRFPRARL